MATELRWHRVMVPDSASARLRVRLHAVASVRKQIFFVKRNLPQVLRNRLATASLRVAREGVTVPLSPQAQKGHNCYQPPPLRRKGHNSRLVPSHKLNLTIRSRWDL